MKIKKYLIIFKKTNLKEKVEIILSYISFKIRIAKPLAGPIFGDIEPINRCNFKCPHCQVPFQNKKLHMISVKELNIILKKIPTLRRVKLQGMGEPFLNKDIMKLASIVSEERKLCEIVTNCSLVKEEHISIMSRLKNFQLIVSFDSDNEKVFSEIRPNSNFHSIVKSLEKIKKIILMYQLGQLFK